MGGAGSVTRRRPPPPLPPFRPGQAYMFNEWYKPDASLEFPVGGSQAMVQALVR